MENIKLGSLFDGIGGFPLAATLHGISPVWASEIEKFPIEVTKIRFPNMKHLGDIMNINGAEIEPVDIITFGSPCQDLSVAGKREGLVDGKRSNLFYQAVRIIREMREATNGVYPRFAVWENVPGAFSSNAGQDFRSVLEEILETEIPMPQSGKWVKSKKGKPIPPNAPTEIRDGTIWYWRIHWAKAGMVRGNGRSLAWRVLDAQYWGVPQRRKRIFLVADFRGQSAPEILFECEGVSGNTAESGEKGQDLTAIARDGIESAIGLDMYNQCLTGDKSMTVKQKQGGDDVPCVLKAREEVAAGVGDGVTYPRDGVQGQSGTVEQFMFENHSQDTRYKGPLEVAQPVTATYGMGGNNQPFVVKATRHDRITSSQTSMISYGIQGSMIGRADKNGPQEDGVNEDVSFTLNTTDRHAVAYGVVSKGNGEAWVTPERHMALNTGGGQAGQGYPAVLTQEPKVYGICSDASNSMKSKNPHSGVYKTGGNQVPIHLDRAAFNQGKNALYDFQVTDDNINSSLVARGPSAVAIPPHYTVRRLTPLECERLQGFPDNWTNIPGASDTGRYTALGNSVAVPCVAWIIGRIKEATK